MNKNPLRENIPCWYDLRWDYNNPPAPTFIISVHEDYIRQWRAIPAGSPMIKAHAEKFGVSADSFRASLDGDFGFDGALKRFGHACDGFVDFSFPIPQVMRRSERLCPECRGSLKSRGGYDCLSCFGSGREYDRNETEAYMRAVSLSLFLWAAQFPPDEDTRAKYPQLFVVQTMACPEPNGASLWGIFCPVFVRHLRSLSGLAFDRDVIESMMAAYYHAVDAPKPDDGFGFGVNVHCGGLHLNCPGDAAGIDPNSSDGIKDGSGYEFNCHNVDSLPQQFALLAGLGQFNVRFRPRC